MKRFLSSKRILILLWSIVFLLGTVQLILANEISTQGGELLKLEERRRHLNDQVVTLRQEVSALGSLARIQDKAQELGFVSNPQALDFIEAPKLAKLQ
jgi:cell division protein FtsL